MMAGPKLSVIPISLLDLLTRLVAEGRLQPNVLWVVARLCTFTNQNGACHPSMDRLAQETGLAANTVRRHVRDLQAVTGGPESSPLLEVYERRKPDGSRDNNGYAFAEWAWTLSEGAPTVELADRSPAESGTIAHVGTPADDGTPLQQLLQGGTATGEGGVVQPVLQGGTATAAAGERPNQRPNQRPSQRPSGSVLPDDTLRAAVQIAAAANAGFRANPHLPPTAIEPLTTAQAVQQVADWLADEIPLALIAEVVTDVARRFRPIGRQTRVSSFGYFDRAVRDASDRARVAALPAARTTWTAIGEAMDQSQQGAA